MILEVLYSSATKCSCYQRFIHHGMIMWVSLNKHALLMVGIIMVSNTRDNLEFKYMVLNPFSYYVSLFKELRLIWTCVELYHLIGRFFMCLNHFCHTESFPHLHTSVYNCCGGGGNHRLNK